MVACVHVRHFSQRAVMYFLHTETDEEVPTQFTRSGLFCMLYGEVDLNVGEHAGAFCRVHAFQFDKGGGVGAETVFFQEERHQYTIQQAD